MRPPSSVLRGGSVLAAIALCLGIAGCHGGSGGKSGTGTPTVVTLSASPTTAPPAPTAPAAARQPTRDGAAAFFRYFWDVYNHAYASMESTTLRSLSEASCKSCLRFLDDIDAAVREGSRFEGGVVTVSVAVAAPGDVARGVLVNGVIDQTAARTVMSDRRIVASAPGSRKRSVDAAVRWDGSQWRMMGLDARTAGK